MTKFAIGYDVDTRGMRDDGQQTKSQISSFYYRIRKCLNQHGFEKMAQQSVYTCQTSHQNTLANVFEVIDCLREIDNETCYIKNLHMFKMEDFNDLRPLVCDAASEEIDPIDDLNARFDYKDPDDQSSDDDNN